MRAEPAGNARDGTDFVARSSRMDRLAADASYSGAPDTLPAAMLDGDTASSGWSNHYTKSATALLHEVSSAHEREWVSIDVPNRRRLDTVTAYFTIDEARGLPAAIRVSYWDGKRFVPVRRPDISWATESNQPTTITFDPVRTDRVRLDLTSRAPNTPTGFLQIAELRLSGAVNAGTWNS